MEARIVSPAMFVSGNALRHGKLECAAPTFMSASVPTASIRARSHLFGERPAPGWRWMRGFVKQSTAVDNAAAPRFVETRCANIDGPVVFSERHEALVKESWAELKKDAGKHALALFQKVFEIAPSAKRLFSFLKDSNEPLEKNPKLKSHALKVFVIICEAATSLRKKGQVSTPGSTMQEMARSHVLSGVADEHYEVVRYALLKTVEEGLPAGKWNDAVREAWSVAYDELVDAIKAQPVEA